MLEMFCLQSENSISLKNYTMSVPDRTAVIHAYRHLYRGLLQAVQYSKPARYTARNQLRTAFRKEDPSAFDQQKINRTLDFLKYAAQERGLEHRMVKSLLHTKYLTKDEIYLYVLMKRGLQTLANRRHSTKTARTAFQKQIRETARTHYDMTLAMLNDSMGLCLR